jgi:hypothetical protein
MKTLRDEDAIVEEVAAPQLAGGHPFARHNERREVGCKVDFELPDCQERGSICRRKHLLEQEFCCCTARVWNCEGFRMPAA